MFHTLDAPADVDLGQYSRLLWQHGISHRIVEHEGRQVLLVARADQQTHARDLLTRWQRGEVKPELGADGRLDTLLGTTLSASSIGRSFMQTPLTLLLIAACIALAVLAPLDGPSDLTFALLYPDFSYGTRTIVLSRVLANFSPFDLLNMLSPILLHGGLLHLVFNMLWLSELGRRIERQQSTLQLAGSIVVLALVSNTAQYLYGGGRNFGGMSGVVYGLFAYIWLWQLIEPRAGLRLPGALLIFMLLTLAVMTVLDLAMIANEAHLYGFFAGLIYGAITATISRLRRVSQSTV